MADNSAYRIPEAGFIDLMGFARGAELANQENWKDTFNDIKAQDEQGKLDQLNFERGIKNPFLSENADEAMGVLKANRNEATTMADIVAKAGALPEAERNAYMTDAVVGRLRALDDPNIEPNQKRFALGALGQSLNSLTQRALSENRPVDALKLITLNPSADPVLKQQANGALWSRPEYYSDPANIATAGGQAQEDGSVLYGGQKLNREQFAEIQRNISFKPVDTNVPGLLGTEAKRAADVKASQALSKRFEDLGYVVFTDPVTGKATLLPKAQAAKAANQFVPGTPEARQLLAGNRDPQAAAATAPTPTAAPVTVPVANFAPDVSQIPGQSVKAPAATPAPQAYSFTDMLAALFGQQPVGVSPGVNSMINGSQAPAQFVPSQNVYNPPAAPAAPVATGTPYNQMPFALQPQQPTASANVQQFLQQQQTPSRAPGTRWATR